MRTFALGLMFLMGGSLSAQRVETGFLDRTVTVSGTSYHYQVYVPANYSTQPKWPVILFLHGAGERGGDGLLQTAVGLAPAIRLAPGKWPAIVVFPQAPTDSAWVGQMAGGRGCPAGPDGLAVGRRWRRNGAGCLDRDSSRRRSGLEPCLARRSV